MAELRLDVLRVRSLCDHVAELLRIKDVFTRQTLIDRWLSLGTVVVVSGVGPDLGRSIALRCAEAGADLVLAARTAARLDEVAKEVTALGRRAVAVPTDITDEASAASWMS